MQDSWSRWSIYRPPSFSGWYPLHLYIFLDNKLHSCTLALAQPQRYPRQQSLNKRSSLFSVGYWLSYSCGLLPTFWWPCSGRRTIVSAKLFHLPSTGISHLASSLGNQFDTSQKDKAIAISQWQLQKFKHRYFYYYYYILASIPVCLTTFGLQIFTFFSRSTSTKLLRLSL